MAEVLLDRVCKRFSADGPLVLRDLTLRVADGEFVALVGPSGCGKSTALRLIAGLDEPSGGVIRVHGVDMRGVPARDRGVAMIFQDSALYPHMTAADNMAFALQMRKMPRETIARRVRAAAEVLQVSELLGRKPASLSGGQRQRIALGRALVRLPEAHCLLLDEPLSQLDSDLRLSLREAIKAVHRHSRATMIYVTHDMDEARALADRIISLRGGTASAFDAATASPSRIETDASLWNVFARPSPLAADRSQAENR